MSRPKGISQLSTANKRFTVPRCTAQELEEFLKKPPPRLEIVSLIEIYRLDEDGNRKSRVCGMPRKTNLPTFVPEGVANPHGVLNPREEYRCCKAAGYATSHTGIGCCRKHSYYSFAQFRGEKFKTRYNLASQFDELVKHEFLKPRSMEKSKDIAVPPENGLSADVDFDYFVTRAKEELTPEQLFDSTRSLYELEAIKLALKDVMRRDGVDVASLEQMADQILKSAQFQAQMAKRDKALMEASHIQLQTKVLVAGLINIVNDTLGEAEAVEVLKRIKTDLVLPINEVGATELLRRQQAAGVTDRVADVANVVEAEFEDIE